MIKTRHKIISVVLSAALVMCAFFALTLSASAASGDTIYVKVNNGWNTSTIYCYMWKNGGGSGNENKGWPGVQMTKVSGTSDVFTYRLTDDYTQIIFNDGSNQTGDLTYTGNGGDGKIYDLSAGKWSQYVEPSSDPTQPTDPPGEGTTVFLKNTAGWSQPRCYMWNSDTDNNGDWPGATMQKVEGDVWVYSASKTFANCIFNPGGDDGKTPDLKNIKSGQIYDYSTGTWSDYDLSPLQIKSYGTDPEGTVYTGVEVALSMNAVSSEGTVSYQFSVNGEVIRSWAASGTAKWTPDTAGTFTVKFEAKDSAGNEKNRTLSVKVESDANASVPIIKKITPADNGYVQTGNANIDVTAGGGKTGTNLLFYKFEIVDPRGASNVAYYTLNPSYRYNFSTEGDYKVTVHVQASDNSEAVKTFTVKATGGDIPTDPTDPGPVYQRGDVNMDGVIDIKDATYLSLFLIEKDGFTVTLELGDFNQDGKMNVSDITALQRYIAER